VEKGIISGKESFKCLRAQDRESAPDVKAAKDKNLCYFALCLLTIIFIFISKK